MRSVARALGVAALIPFGMVASPSGAWANGRFPQAQTVVLGPGARDDLVVLRATFGLAASDDGGRRFRFLCEDFFEYPDGYDPPIWVGRDGTLLVGLGDGLAATRDWCTRSVRAELTGYEVSDLAGDARGAVLVASLVSHDARPVSRVARSDDGGATWHVPSEGLAGQRITTVELAPSNPLRVYASAVAEPDGQPGLFRSDDGGVTLRRTLWSADNTVGVFVSAVDPARPERVYLRALTAHGESVLYESDDGGDTARERLRTAGPMRGFALSDDGRSLFVGTPDPREGLQRSLDGGPFQRVSERPVECLRFHAGALWVCQSFTPGAVMLARSVDGGEHFEDRLGYADLEAPPRCAPGSIMQTLCPMRYSQVQRVLGAGQRDAGGPDASLDAGVSPPQARPSCGCSTVGHRKNGGWALAAMLMVVLGWRRCAGGTGRRC